MRAVGEKQGKCPALVSDVGVKIKIRLSQKQPLFLERP